jgi:hypothetical protein
MCNEGGILISSKFKHGFNYFIFFRKNLNQFSYKFEEFFFIFDKNKKGSIIFL